MSEYSINVPLSLIMYSYFYCCCGGYCLVYVTYSYFGEEVGIAAPGADTDAAAKAA